ncbi:MULTISPECIES: ABC transporter ATP-binding protein [unclassified Adlercreutzia]|uniref:ABC transporter ATP-binding protein n=1 Tax=unclassified Adlercreutzia TaxID=2636013 RepID=UPI0019821E3C|nr:MULTISPECIES: ABC transporter ATP-binding protein [unclassified Adlercreutzia]
MSALPAVIEARGLTKDYGRGRGVFDVTFAVARGEAVGFLGANGAGKTVTMRALMGFIRPGAGSVSIEGRRCFADRARIQETLGYLPGELALPEDMTAKRYLAFVARMRGADEAQLRRMRALADFFELDVRTRIGRMSKGTKQKVGIVAAFAHAPRVLLLDEPTSGLDLLMQQRFVELVRAEKRRGATILLSSHLLGEVERTCDRALFVRGGRLVSEEPAASLTLEETLAHLYGAGNVGRSWDAPGAACASGDASAPAPDAPDAPGAACASRRASASASDTFDAPGDVRTSGEGRAS